MEITSSSDGALWFTNSGNDSIGRITTSGVATDYKGPGINFPDGIASGSDGALWFINRDSASIGRITTSGVVTDYTSPSIDYPYSISAGPDGALWFTNDPGRSIGRITTSGFISNYTGSGISSPSGIAPGPDGAMWFTNYGNNTIGRITVVPSETISPTSGAPGRTISVSGAGYGPGEQVNVKYETGLSGPGLSEISICAAIVNPNGTFSCLGHIPHALLAGSLGSHVIEAVGKSSRAIAKATFTLT